MSNCLTKPSRSTTTVRATTATEVEEARKKVVTSKAPSTGLLARTESQSKVKVAAVHAGPLQQPQCRKPCNRSLLVIQLSAYLSRKVSTVTVGHMVAAVAGCTTTGSCLKRLDHSLMWTTPTRLRMVAAETKTTRESPLGLLAGAGSATLAIRTTSTESRRSFKRVL